MSGSGDPLEDPSRGCDCVLYSGVDLFRLLGGGLELSLAAFGALGAVFVLRVVVVFFECFLWHEVFDLMHEENVPLLAGACHAQGLAALEQFGKDMGVSIAWIVTE